MDFKKYICIIRSKAIGKMWIFGRQKKFRSGKPQFKNTSCKRCGCLCMPIPIFGVQKCSSTNKSDGVYPLPTGATRDELTYHEPYYSRVI